MLLVKLLSFGTVVKSDHVSLATKLVDLVFELVSLAEVMCDFSSLVEKKRGHISKGNLLVVEIKFGRVEAFRASGWLGLAQGPVQLLQDE